MAASNGRVTWSWNSCSNTVVLHRQAFPTVIQARVLAVSDPVNLGERYGSREAWPRVRSTMVSLCPSLNPAHGSLQARNNQQSIAAVRTGYVFVFKGEKYFSLFFFFFFVT